MNIVFFKSSPHFGKEKGKSRKRFVSADMAEKHGGKPMYVKMNGYTLRTNNFIIFIAASYINWGHLIKKGTGSHRSKFIPPKGERLLGRLRLLGKQTGSHEIGPPLYPKVLKYWDTYSCQFSICLKWKINFFRCPSIQAHCNEAVIYLNFGTPKNNEFSIWNKWKIYYF